MRIVDDRAAIAFHVERLVRVGDVEQEAEGFARGFRGIEVGGSFTCGVLPPASLSMLMSHGKGE
jgi:hypothetical protein